MEKNREGVCFNRERGDIRAQIITDDYEPQGFMAHVTANVMTEKIEVRDFKAADREFKDFTEKAGRDDFVPF